LSIRSACPRHHASARRLLALAPGLDVRLPLPGGACGLVLDAAEERRPPAGSPPPAAGQPSVVRVGLGDAGPRLVAKGRH
jgi:hypothetical protein